MLPKIPYAMHKNKSQSIPMRSINLGPATEPGELSDSLGISTRKFPYLSVRQGDSKLAGYEGIKAMTVFGGEHVTVREDGIYVGGALVKSSDIGGEKIMVPINSKLVMFPNKLYLEQKGENWQVGNLEAQVHVDVGNANFLPNSLSASKSKSAFSGFGGKVYNGKFSGYISRTSVISGTYLFCRTGYIVSGERVAEGQIKKQGDGTLLVTFDRGIIIPEKNYSVGFVTEDSIFIVDRVNYQVNCTNVEIGYGYTIDEYNVVVTKISEDGDTEIDEEEKSCDMYYLRTGDSDVFSGTVNRGSYVTICDQDEHTIVEGEVTGSSIKYITITPTNMEKSIVSSGNFRINTFGWSDDIIKQIQINDSVSFGDSPEILEVSDVIFSNKDFTITFNNESVEIHTGPSETLTLFKHTTDNDIFSNFKKGDAVEISGSLVKAAEEDVSNDISFIISEIRGNTLITSSDIFNEGLSISAITISRIVPDLDFICEKDNRLYGVSNSEKTIYVSALGDPTNMYTYEGVSTDSYAVPVGGEGDFTACCKYGDAVLFFKEDKLYKLTGSYPAEFALYSYDIDGIERGSEKSCVVINEVLYYKGRQGVYAYTGGIPVLVSECFGEKIFTDAVAGSDGRYYYLSVLDENENPYLFTYDTRTQIWLIEEKVRCVDFARTGEGLHYAGDDGYIYRVGAGDGEREWLARWAPIYELVDGKRCYSRILLRVSLPRGSYIIIKIRCDDGEWREAGKIVGKTEAVVPIRIPINRCDKFELELSGKGECTILDIMREFYVGSEV